MSDTRGGARSSAGTVDQTQQGLEQAGAGRVGSVEQIDRTETGADPDGGGAGQDSHPARGLKR